MLIIPFSLDKNVGKSWENVIGIQTPRGSEIPINICGWLHKMKRMQRKFHSQWVRRWFTVQDGLLRWYYSPNSERCNGFIALQDISTVKKFGGGAHDNCRFIIHSSFRNMLLRTDSYSDVCRWTRGITLQLDLLAGGDIHGPRPVKFCDGVMTSSQGDENISTSSTIESSRSGQSCTPIFDSEKIYQIGTDIFDNHHCRTTRLIDSQKGTYELSEQVYASPCDSESNIEVNVKCESTVKSQAEVIRPDCDQNSAEWPTVPFTATKNSSCTDTLYLKNLNPNIMEITDTKKLFVNRYRILETPQVTLKISSLNDEKVNKRKNKLERLNKSPSQQLESHQATADNFMIDNDDNTHQGTLRKGKGRQIRSGLIKRCSQKYVEMESEFDIEDCTYTLGVRESALL